MAVVLFALAVLLSASGKCGAERVFEDLLTEDSEKSDSDERSGAIPGECLQHLESVIPQITYREIFSPVFSAVYELVALDGSGYLTMKNGKVIVQAKDDAEKQRFRWNIRALDPNLDTSEANYGTLPRVFYLENEKDVRGEGGVLTGTKTGAGNDVRNIREKDEGQWFLQMLPAKYGLSFALVNRAHGKFRRVPDDSPGVSQSLLVPDNSTEDTMLSFGWEMKRISRPRLLSRIRRISLGRQWAIAKKTPLTGLGRFTWGDVCQGEDCYQIYEMEQKRMVGYGRVDVDDYFTVTDNKVRGVCDWVTQSLRGMMKNVNLIRDIKVSLKARCGDHSFVAFSELLKEATENVCFKGCTDDLRNHIKAANGGQPGCPALDYRNFDFDQFYSDLYDTSEACAALLPDTVEDLTDFVLKQECHTWSPPTFLWSSDDKVPDDIALYDYDAVCSVFHAAAETSRSSRDIVQVGTCPEGTTCQCPDTWAFAKETTSMMRSKNTMFLKEGSATVPFLLSTIVKKSLAKVATSVLPAAIIAGTLATFSLKAAIVSAPVIMATVFGLASALLSERGEWRCRYTVGCWPAMPAGDWKPWTKRGGHVCRVPEIAKRGGSPVWFLPPPDMWLERYGLFKRACRLSACTADNDPRVQKVGFSSGKQENIFNCQPLTWERMNTAQRVKLLEELTAAGVAEEYDLSEAWAMTKQVPASNFQKISS